MAGFRAATCGMAGAAARWRERAAKGMSDGELAKALAYEIGIFGGSSSADGVSLTYQAAGLKIWIRWEIENTHEQPPTFQGGRQWQWPVSCTGSRTSLPCFEVNLSLRPVRRSFFS